MSNRRWRLKTNRHPTTRGEPWGWIEAPDGIHVLFWSGEQERAAAAKRAEELDRIGWGELTDAERRRVR